MTSWASGAEELLPKFGSFEYDAVILCVPVVRLDTKNDVWPLELTDCVPSGVAPSKRVTCPVSVPDGLLVTLTVKVVDWPNTVGLTEEVIVVVVADLLTTWLKAKEVLAR